MTTKAAPMTDTPTGEVDAATPRQTTAPAPRRRRWPLVLAWTVAVLALAAAVWSTWQWQQLASRQDAVDRARVAALGFVEDLTNWDASDGLEDEIEVLRAQGTGPFLEEIEFVFGGDELTSQLEADGVAATGEIQEAFVQDVDGDLAEVFTVVEVTYAAETVESELDPVTFPASLVLERADDGTWLVREVTIPNSNQIGQMMAPSTEAG